MGSMEPSERLTHWSIWLSAGSALLALTALSLTLASYLSVRAASKKRSTLGDLGEIRPLIAEFVLGAKLWQTYLAVALTAASVLTGAGANIVGALA
jgi:hypothetical protein